MSSPTGVEFKALYPIILMSVFMFIVCMLIFGIAVHRGMNRLFAPRSWARPKAIIKNQLKKPYCVSWISWALNLSYSEMLEGIDGTGTRNNGWSGPKLNCNLDGIILIKYANLCLKVAALATVLCLGLVLPVNYTAGCPDSYEVTDEGSRVCSNITQLTSFEKTTMANIPELVYGDNSTWYSPEIFHTAFGDSTGVTMRMLTTLLVCFVIYTYTCVLVWEEWIQNLALRRVYYLEYNHYERRKAEIEYIESLKDPEDANTTNRPVWVVHPEYRDTVPNISLYSVLFRLPLVDPDDNLSVATDSDVGRQLRIAIEFFDKVVPNQPGFSSSIAALTILPDVKRLSMAWKKWFRCASKVRRLNFIRKRLQQLKEEQKAVISHENGNENINNGTSVGYSLSHRNEDLIDLGNSKKGKEVKFKEDLVRHGSRNAIGGSISDELESAIRSATADIQKDSNMEMFLDEDEIEQMSVYFREYARSSASCGPYGCDEYAILQADLVTLEDLYQEAAEEVSVAVDQLHQARNEIRADEPISSPFKAPDDISIQSDVSDANRNLKGIAGEKKTSDLWKEAEKLVGSERYKVKLGNQVLKRKLNTGSWYNPFARIHSLKNITFRSFAESCIPSAFLARTKSESYAVVTFTSRQAAIAARQCLSDGSGLDGWREVDKIPVPPLADSVPFGLCKCDCRGCCRPVTVTLQPGEKRWRYKLVIVIMIVFSTCWTIPFFKTSPEALEEAFAGVENIENYAQFLSPLLNAAIMTGFFAILPQIFKMFANFSGEASSIQEAERHALIYYWWFMLVFVFGGKTLGNIIVSMFRNNEVSISETQKVIKDLTLIVPTTQSMYWLIWMIAQTGIILPFMYFLMFNNFMFTALNWDCCARATAGGGPGGVVPYRVYVNCSVIFLCLVALAPLCPIVAPFSLLYFLFLTPLLKWGFVFIYRPTFDAGGMRWPLLHNILMISIITSQVLLTISFVLKNAYLVAIITALSIIATSTFKKICEETFEQSYNDAALLQTSELDGWNVDEEMSFEERERYRKWAVDCHKASYVPVCVNAEDDYLTSEPAVVIPTQNEMDNQSTTNGMDSNEFRDQSSSSSPKTYGRQRTSTLDSYNSFLSQRQGPAQRGAIFRRVTGTPATFHTPSAGHSSFILEEGESQQFIETMSENDLRDESRDKLL